MDGDDLAKKRSFLEGVGVVFCKEGGEVCRRAGIRLHEGAADGPGGSRWVALARLDRPLSTDEHLAAMEVLKWCASTGYETAI